MKNDIKELLIKGEIELIQSKINQFEDVILKYKKNITELESREDRLIIEEIIRRYNITEPIETIKDIKGLKPNVSYHKLKSFVPKFMDTNELSDDVLKDFSMLYVHVFDDWKTCPFRKIKSSVLREKKHQSNEFYKSWKSQIEWYEGRCDGIDRRKSKIKN